MRRFAIVTVLLLLTVGQAHGQACVDYASYTRVIADEILPLNAGDVVVDGGYAYTACPQYDKPYGLMVLDVADPATPELVGTGGTYWLNSGLGRISPGLDVVGDLVYLLSDAGIEIVDVQDRTNPVGRGVAALNDPRAIAVAGDDAFIADYADGLVVLDVGNPDAPAAVTTLALGSNPFALVVEGDYAYVATVDSLFVIDVSTPASPSVSGALFVSGGSLRSIAKSGNTIYLGQFSPNAGLFAVDVVDPANPSHLGDLLVNYPYDIVIDGTTAYVTGEYGRLLVVDVANPAAMFEIHRIDANGRWIDFDGTTIFMGSSNGLPRFKTITLATNESPGSNGAYTLLASARYIRMSSGAAQVIGVESNAYNLDTIDITGGGPFFPMLDHRRICDYDPFSAIDLQPGLMAFTAGDEIYLIDIADPTDTWVAGSFLHGELIWSATLDGHLLYVVDQFGLHVYDISNRSSMSPIGFRQRSDLYGTDVQGDFVYAARKNHGLEIFDVSDPTNPTLRGILSGADFEGVIVDGDYAYLTGGHVSGVADISDPDNPVLVWHEGSNSDARNIQKFGDLVASPAGCGTVEILDVSNPLDPVRLSAPVVPSCYSLDVAMAAGLILIAASDDGMLTYPGHCAAVSAAPTPVLRPDFARISIAPNPFNPRTVIGVEIPVAAPVTMGVYGLDGSLVQQIHDGELPAGHHQFEWNGVDTGGQPVASGAYFMVLDSPGGRQSARMLLIK